jgi:hypothetical protein
MRGLSGLFGLPLPLAVIGLLVCVCLCVHVHRTGQSMYWMYLIIFIQPMIGAAIYFAAVILPGLMGGPTARRAAVSARETLDPGREHRRAKAAYDDTPSVQNGMKLAEAATALGRWAEADQLYATILQGIYADDPALLEGRARVLVELGRPNDALEVLAHLAAQGGLESPQATLVRARALEALGRFGEADRFYQSAVERLPGLEAMARYTAFLAQVGRRDEARQTLAEIDRRVAKTRAHFRREAQAWRDFAAQRAAA